MANVTKRVLEVVEMLKDGKPLDFNTYVAKLNCKPITAMVYVSDLRKMFGADIETIRDGRKVVSYKLLNADELLATIDKKLKSKPIKTVAAKVAKPVKAKSIKTAVAKAKVATKPKADEFDVPTLDADMEITEISDREFADLRDQLGF
jgi:hypothetical protein